MSHLVAIILIVSKYSVCRCDRLEGFWRNFNVYYCWLGMLVHTKVMYLPKSRGGSTESSFGFHAVDQRKLSRRFERYGFDGKSFGAARSPSFQQDKVKPVGTVCC